MKAVRTLLVDDSAVFRAQMRTALEKVEGVEVVGTASNGVTALERLRQGDVDLVTVDLRMPVMCGLQLLSRMKELGLAMKTIVFCASTKGDAESALAALKLGASDFVTKPVGYSESAPAPHESIRAVLAPRIRALFPALSLQAPRESAIVPVSSMSQALWEVYRPKVVVIGSSTGGPSALERVFSELRGPSRCPILIAQHMPPGFTASLAERLGKLSKIPAAEAQHQEPLLPNRIYVAPGDFHMVLERDKVGDGARIVLNKGPMENSVRPAVDPLFRSAAQVYGKKCLGIVLTGMGEDGKSGAREIKRAGGAVMIQDKDSCVVFGMPGAIHATGDYDKIGDLKEVSKVIREKAVA